jgi:hypothetical protein
MSDVTNIFNRLTNLEVAPQFDAYSKVIIHVSDDTTYEVGDNSGRTLEIDNPFGTQPMAQAILNSLRGFQYQPYTADGALLDPAAEIGDGANMRGSYGGIYTRDRTFGRLMKADISAPCDEEINHEYQYESPERREFKRSIDAVKASLIIANDNIEAKVSRESPEGQTSFSWKLLSDSHKWYANGNEVMSVSASGLKVTGEIQATSGKIGGFDINAEDLRFNNLNYGDTDKNYGVYIGKRGIQLGKAFMVSNSGYVAADSMTLTGTLTIGGQQITASSLRSGAQSAYNWSTNGTSSYWSGGAGYGYSYNAATQTSATNYPSYFTCGTLRLMNGLVRIENKILGLQTRTISGVTINYLGY